MPIVKPDLGPCNCHFSAGNSLYLQGDGSKASPVEISVENAAHEYTYAGGVLDYTQFPGMSTVLITLEASPGSSMDRYVFPDGGSVDLNLIFKNPSPTETVYVRSSPKTFINVAPSAMSLSKMCRHMGDLIAFTVVLNVPIP